MNQIEVREEDRVAAADFFAKNPNLRNLEVLEKRVDDAFELARVNAHDPLGQSRGVAFVTNVLYPARRIFKFHSRRLGNSKLERGAWCCAAARFFETCAAMPLAVMQPAGNAAVAQPQVVAPAPPTFNPRAMIARIAAMGVSLSVNAAGEIVASPAQSLQPQIKEQIRRNRVEILDALRASEVIA